MTQHLITILEEENITTQHVWRSCAYDYGEVQRDMLSGLDKVQLGYATLSVRERNRHYDCVSTATIECICSCILETGSRRQAANE